MPDRDEDITKLIAIMQMNQDKNFIQRIMQPDINPILHYGEPGQWGTHLMTGTTLSNGENIVYPQIIQSNGGNLQLLNQDDALNYALNNNEYIKVGSPEEVNWFGENYKKLWGW